MLCWLQQEPDTTAKVLFERIQDECPWCLSDGQLRTLQRRVREWRTIMARKLVYACIDENVKYQYKIQIKLKSATIGATSRIDMPGSTGYSNIHSLGNGKE